MALAQSVVVVVHDMARELPRTLATLDPRHQRGVDADGYEVVVVDNGSAADLYSEALEGFSGQLRLHVVDDAPPSPARAANEGIAVAAGNQVGLVVDGARMASPGLLAMAGRASALAERVVVTAPAYHLGPVPHMRAQEAGYDQAAEDALLAEIDWHRDGYALFSVSVFAGSSHRGWFGPMGESSSLFMAKEMWVELGGLDEAFDLPGGGLVNHDLYHRVCSLQDVELVSLLGEGTFHQIHGGAATSRRFTFAEMDDQYERLRGRRYRPPANVPVHLGRVPDASLGHLARSVGLAVERARLASPAPGSPTTEPVER